MLVNITIPVFNEETRLLQSLPRLRLFLCEHCRFTFEVVVADNASTDGTLAIARELCSKHEGLRLVHLNEKGRGRAVKKVWSESSADILSYMDVDLSTDLFAFPPLIEALMGGGFDLATGSRLLKPSLTTRTLKREVISRCYNRLIKLMFRARFSDAQCGFKAITRAAASALLPMVDDNGWFMDSELLILAERLGYRIFDLPVRWTENSDSRVKIWSTALDDVKGLMRVRTNVGHGTFGPRRRDIDSLIQARSEDASDAVEVVVPPFAGNLSDHNVADLTRPLRSAAPSLRRCDGNRPVVAPHEGRSCLEPQAKRREANDHNRTHRCAESHPELP
jgi:glycosyltransferase involved in cell wall biosynthesis